MQDAIHEILNDNLVTMAVGKKDQGTVKVILQKDLGKVAGQIAQAIEEGDDNNG